MAPLGHKPAAVMGEKVSVDFTRPLSQVPCFLQEGCICQHTPCEQPYSQLKACTEEENAFSGDAKLICEFLNSKDDGSFSPMSEVYTSFPMEHSIYLHHQRKKTRQLGKAQGMGELSTDCWVLEVPVQIWPGTGLLGLCSLGTQQ